MKPTNVLIAVVCTIIVVFHSGCLGGRDDKILVTTLGELMNDYAQNIDNDTKKITSWIKSLNHGDVLLIRDKISNLTYIEVFNYTAIEFESLLGEGFPIKEDITNTFGVGDNVELKLTIINVTYTQQVDGEIWTIQQETFEEGWDSINNTFVPIPKKYLTFSEIDETRIITTTMNDLINDYEQSVDNDTKIISYSLKSLNNGDTLIIQDSINDITYNASGDYTVVDFETIIGYTLFFVGDITETFHSGDDIEIQLHIIKVSFTQQNPYTGEMWLIEHETFKEGWDSANNTFVPIPQKYITHT